MQRFRVAHYGISLERSVFSQYTHERPSECAYQEIQETSGIFHNRP